MAENKMDMVDLPDWSALPMDLLGSVASCFPIVEDFMAFRGVCSSWRAAAAKARFVPVSKVPLLMLAEKDESDEREFYSLSKRKICMRMPVPDAQGRRCIGVGFGWILTLAPTGEVSLLKPFSSARIELPSFKTFPNYRDYNPTYVFVRRAFLTANPSQTLNFALVLNVIHDFGFWRNGGEKWEVINASGGCLAATCWNGKIYCLNFKRQILIWDPLETDLNNPQGLAVSVVNAPNTLNGFYPDYLVVSSSGELLIITRNNAGGYHYLIGANNFTVKRVDLEKGKCIEINDLGKDAVFLGNNTAVSVDTTEFPGVLKPNSVYFTNDYITAYHHNKKWSKGGGKDMGIYNVEDRTIERFGFKSIELPDSD